MSVPARRPGAPLALAALATAVAAAACGSDPTSPLPGLGGGGVVTTYTASTPVGGTLARSSYSDTLLAWEQLVFFWGDRVNFAQQGAAVRQRVAAANTHGALWDAADASIDPWLLNAPPGGQDLHSAFFRPEEAPGLVDSPADTARRYIVVGDTLTKALAPGAGRVGYLWFPNYAGKTPQGRVDSTQAVIRAVDQAAPCGWVLDQRFNYGGDIAAMLLGLNPILGDAPASATQNGLGGLVFSDSSRQLFYLQNGQVGVYETSEARRYAYDVRVANGYVQKRPNTPVAILLSPVTASAGELITLAFRGGPVPYRTFGDPTFGLTTGPLGRYLRPDSGFLNITASVMFDRLGRQYGTSIAPDQQVTGPSWRTLTPGQVLRNGDPVLSAAVQWLQSQPTCTGAPAASRGVDPAATTPVAARLPGRPGPSPLHEWTSRYFLPRGRAAALAGH